MAEYRLTSASDDDITTVIITLKDFTVLQATGFLSIVRKLLDCETDDQAEALEQLPSAIGFETHATDEIAEEDDYFGFRRHYR